MNRCPACGAEPRPGASSCGQCGAPISEPGAPPLDVSPFRLTGKRFGSLGEAVEPASGAQALVLSGIADRAQRYEAAHLSALLSTRSIAGVARVVRANPWVFERPRGRLLGNNSGPLELELAVDLTLQLLERLGSIHSIGWSEIPFGASSLWIDGTADPYLTLLVPGEGVSRSGRPNVRGDLWFAVANLVAWVRPSVRWEFDFADALKEITEQRGRRGRELVSFLEESSAKDRVTARSVATLVAEISRKPSRWKARVATIADIDHVRRRFDWDWIIGECERELGGRPLSPDVIRQAESRDNFGLTEIAYVLARAHQQRARRSFAARRFGEAHADIRRAVEIDPLHAPYAEDLAVMAAADRAAR